jgi:hypothetical protein
VYCCILLCNTTIYYCSYYAQAKWAASREGGAIKDHTAGSNLKFDAMMHGGSDDEHDSDSDDDVAPRVTSSANTSSKSSSKRDKSSKKKSDSGGDFMVRETVRACNSVSCNLAFYYCGLCNCCVNGLCGVLSTALRQFSTICTRCSGAKHCASCMRLHSCRLRIYSRSARYAAASLGQRLLVIYTALSSFPARSRTPHDIICAHLHLFSKHTHI